MINRETLAALYLDRVNNYLTNTTFADHLGLHEDEARKLLEVAKSCFENDHPDQ
jgi:CRISPR/Cas system type I-B associated protein Csh2 (Cas7 group RAMP superfamily)